MIYAIVVILILIADQALKYWVTLSIPLDEGVRAFVPGVLELRNIHNNGVAFSLLSGASRWIFIVLALVVSAGIILAVRKKWVRSAFGRWMSILVIAGALGNALDRMLSGYVVDMLAFQFWPSFPVFNIADVSLTIGAIGLILHFLFYREPEEKQRPAAKTPRPAQAKTVSADDAKTRRVKPRAKTDPAERPVASPEQPTQRVDMKARPAQPKTEAPKAAPVKPAVPPKPTPEKPAEPEQTASADPFAAWDQAIQSLEAESKAKAKAEAERRSAPEPIPEPKPSEVKPTVQRPKKPAGDSFSLEDILAEFKDE